MKKSEAKQKCIEFLISKGYIFNGNNITPPDAEHPLDAMAIQDEMEEISDCNYTLRYVGDNLRIVKV